MLVLRDAYAGLTRFDQFRKSLGIVPTMLTKRLKALTEDGLLEKRLYSERPPREEYLLTDAGRDFLPVLMMIGAWAHRHCDGDLARFIDAETGAEIEPVVISAANAPRIRADVVGPVCETGDYLAQDREMAQPKPGDLIAVGSAGAYGAVQAGTYNSRLLIPEVLVNGAEFHVVRPRLSYDDLIGLDSIPAWLA